MGHSEKFIGPKTEEETYPDRTLSADEAHEVALAGEYKRHELTKYSQSFGSETIKKSENYNRLKDTIEDRSVRFAELAKILNSGSVDEIKAARLERGQIHEACIDDVLQFDGVSLDDASQEERAAASHEALMMLQGIYQREQKIAHDGEVASSHTKELENSAEREEELAKKVIQNPGAKDRNGEPYSYRTLSSDLHEKKRWSEFEAGWTESMTNISENPLDPADVAKMLIDIQSQCRDKPKLAAEVGETLEGLYTDDSKTVAEIKQMVIEIIKKYVASFEDERLALDRVLAQFD